MPPAMHGTEGANGPARKTTTLILARPLRLLLPSWPGLEDYYSHFRDFSGISSGLGFGPVVIITLK